MPVKRASRGRKKGGKGSSGVVQCTNCGQTVPKDKAKKVTSRLSLVEHQLAKELRAHKGATSINFRKFMSAKAFSLTAYYDSIVNFLKKKLYMEN